MADRILKDHVRVNQTALTGVIWGGTALSFCFIAFRMYARLATFRRLFIDDVLALLAWLMLLSMTILAQSAEGGLYLQFAISEGKALPTPDNLSKLSRFLHIFVAIDVLLVTCVWTVKASFLAFFWRLGQRVRGQKLLWWSVTSVTLATYVAAIGIIPYRCDLGKVQHISLKCAFTRRLGFVRKIVHALCFMDAVTDVLTPTSGWKGRFGNGVTVLLIPFTMLWNVQIELRKKLILGGLFSLTLIVMVVTLVRGVISASYVVGNSHDLDGTWLFFWGAIEVPLAIIIACSASFRQFFVKQDGAGLGVGGTTGTMTPFAAIVPKSERRESKVNSLDFDDGGKTGYKPWPRSRPGSLSSEEHGIPLNSIHVQHDIAIESSVPIKDIEHELKQSTVRTTQGGRFSTNTPSNVKT